MAWRYAKGSVCNAHQRLIARALPEYAQDNDDRLPAASRWMDTATRYIPPTVKNVFAYPENRRSPYGYAFNSGISSKAVGSFQDPSNVVLIYDSDANRRNASDALTSVPTTARHSGSSDLIFAFADGRSHAIKLESKRASGRGEAQTDLSNGPYFIPSPPPRLRNRMWSRGSVSVSLP